VYPNVYPCLAAHHVAKFRELPPTGPRVISAHTLNFKPIFECSFLKKLLGDPVPVGVYASKPGSFSSACKNFMGQRLLVLSEVVLSGPNFTGLLSQNAEGIAVDTLVFRFRIS